MEILEEKQLKLKFQIILISYLNNEYLKYENVLLLQNSKACQFLILKASE